jgi:biotin synthase
MRSPLRIEFDSDSLNHWMRVRGEEQADLQELARLERRRHFGDRLFLRAVVEISNYCESSCLYCGMRKQNTTIPRYRLTHDEVVDAIGRAIDAGVGTIMLQSGQDPLYTTESICRICADARSMGMRNVILCLGMRPRADYEAFWAAGANKYIMKHETANARLFAKSKPGNTLFSRLHHLLHLRRLGFAIGSGCMCGLPGQNDQDLVADMLLLQRMRSDMASVSPFIHSQDTPYSDHPNGDLSVTLNLMALLRLMLGNVLIPSVSALETLSAGFQLRGLQSGANVVTLNMTPMSKRSNYVIYRQGRKIVDLTHVRNLAEQAQLAISAFPES